MQFEERPDKINLLAQGDNFTPRGRKIRKISKIFLYAGIAVVLGLFIFTYQVLFTDTSVMSSLNSLNIFSQLANIARGTTVLKGETDGRINILLLGIGGAGHDGPNLTDTNILLSIEPKTKKVAAVSIPRDLLVNIPDKGWWKINNANHFGEVDNPGAGGEYARQVFSEVFNLPIQYFVRVDFSGFEQFIDELGGVRVYVDESFSDSSYPTDDYKYQTIAFQAGWQAMNGDRALKYARSRHGDNGEGSDFARSRRQQKILEAVKEQVLSSDTFLNPRKINALLKMVSQHVKTNFGLDEIIALLDLTKTLDTKNVLNLVLDDAPTGLLYASNVNGAYVLQPKSGNFQTIQFLIQNIFTNQQAIGAAKIIPKLEVRNSTAETGLAAKTADELKLAGYKVMKIGNALEQNLEKNLIYRLTTEAQPDTEKYLTEKFNASIEPTVPSAIRDDADLTTDYYIVIGTDYIK
jgi:LCP family protein required for cell wall assembly